MFGIPIEIIGALGFGTIVGICLELYWGTSCDGWRVGDKGLLDGYLFEVVGIDRRWGAIIYKYVDTPPNFRKGVLYKVDTSHDALAKAKG